jgi:dienelactone hydrolase
VELASPKIVVVGVDAGSSTPALDSLEHAVRSQGMTWQRCDITGLSPHLKALFKMDGSPTPPIAVCGIGADAEPALKSAAESGHIVAVALIDPTLSEDSIQLIREWPEMAVMALANPVRRAELGTAVNAYLASSNPVSELFVGELDDALASSAASWLDARLASSTSTEDIMVVSSDDWELYGTLRMPTCDGPIPGIVLLHSARSDRAVYSRLERLLAERGMAVLNLDWRGRGQSTGRGSLWTLSDQERAESWRDGVAALAALSERSEVDSQRLGILGAAQGAEIAVRAALRDQRVRAVTILTGYEPADVSEEDFLVGGSAELLFVTSSDHRDRTQAMRQLYQRSKGRRTRFIEYPGSALGYQLFDVDPALETVIAAWFAEVLSE